MTGVFAAGSDYAFDMHVNSHIIIWHVYICPAAVVEARLTLVKSVNSDWLGLYTQIYHNINYELSQNETAILIYMYQKSSCIYVVLHI